MKKLLGIAAFILSSLVSQAQIDSAYYSIPPEARIDYGGDSILILVTSTTGRMEVCAMDSSYAKEGLGVVDSMKIGNKPNSEEPEYIIVGKKVFNDRYEKYVAFPKGYRPKNSPSLIVQEILRHDRRKGAVVNTWLLWEKMDVYIYAPSGHEFYHYVTYLPFDFLPDENNGNEKKEKDLTKKLHQTKPEQSYKIIVKDRLGRVREKIEDVHFLM